MVADKKVGLSGLQRIKPFVNKLCRTVTDKFLRIVCDEFLETCNIIYFPDGAFEIQGYCSRYYARKKPAQTRRQPASEKRSELRINDQLCERISDFVVVIGSYIFKFTHTTMK